MKKLFTLVLFASLFTYVSAESCFAGLGNDLLESYIELGYQKYQQKDYQGAIEAFDRVLIEEPFLASHAKAYCFRGMAKEQLGRQREALEDYTWANEVNPKYAEAYYRKARIYAKYELLDKVIENCDLATKLDPNNAEAFALLELTQMKLNADR